jgi:hypothetical protein
VVSIAWLQHAREATFVIVGESMFSVAPQCVDGFADPDAIQFAAFSHPTEMLTVAAGISIRNSLLQSIAQRSVQLAQAGERSTSVNVHSRASALTFGLSYDRTEVAESNPARDATFGQAGQIKRGGNTSAGGNCR